MPSELGSLTSYQIFYEELEARSKKAKAKANRKPQATKRTKR